MTEKEIIKNILIDSWRELEKLFKRTPYLCEDDNDLKEYYKKLKNFISSGSMIRVFGSEAYLRCHLFRIINKKVKRKRIRLKDVIVSVEGGNNFFGKRPDIIIWKPKKMNGTPKIWTDTKINELIEECLAVVELKVTGYELIKQGGKDELYKDIKKYHSTISTWTDSPLPLIFYGCYYEDDPNRIKNLVAPRNLNYKRIVDSYKKTRRLSLNKNFDDNFIEAYGFRGNNEDWLVLKQ